MLVVQETTQWNCSFNVPGHIYFLNNSRSKLYAYINDVTGESTIFKIPKDFSVKGRTFDVLRKVKDDYDGIPVTGSKGDVYYVKERGGEWQCTCTGFKFHGTCKHIDQVR